MTASLRRLIGALLLLAAGASSVAGCGGGGGATAATGTAKAAGATHPPMTKAQAIAFARSVNLQAADLPDLRVSESERPGKVGADEGAFARCVGETNPRDAIAKVKSATFSYPQGFGRINSSVEVQPSSAVAGANLRASLQPRLLSCLKNMLPALLAGNAERAARYGAVSVSRMPGLTIPGSTGVEIRTSIMAPRLPYPIPIYIDEFGFVSGPAEIGLQVASAPRPIEPEIEARLLSLLYSRTQGTHPRTAQTPRSAPQSVSPRRPAQATEPNQATWQATWTAQARADAAEHAQRPGTCRVPPPQVHFPTGEWTATETTLTTNAIDGCAGERVVRPVDFRRVCKAGPCRTLLFSAGYYGVVVAKIVPEGRDGYLAVFQPTPVPCPHRPGQYAGTNQDYSTITLWWSPDRRILHGLGREHQVGRCGGGPGETYSFVATRSNPNANPPAQGP